MKMKLSFLLGLGLLAVGTVAGQNKSPSSIKKTSQKDEAKKEFYQLWCGSKGNVLTGHYFYPAANGKMNFISLKDNTLHPEKDGTWSSGVSYHVEGENTQVSLSVKDPTIAKNVANIFKISEKVCKTEKEDIIVEDGLSAIVKDDFDAIHKVLRTVPAASEDNSFSERSVGRVVTASDKDGKDEFQVRCANGNLVSADFFFENPPGVTEEKRAYIVLGDSAHAFKEKDGTFTPVANYTISGWRIEQRTRITDPSIEKHAAYILETAKKVCAQHPDETLVKHNMLTAMVVDNFTNMQAALEVKRLDMRME